MGILEWLGLRRPPAAPSPPAASQPVQAVGPGPQQAPGPKPASPFNFQKPSDWKLPREDVRYISDSEKLNLVLQGVYSVYEELRPMAQDGSRVSRLQLLLENLTPEERANAKKTLEDLDIDNAILRFLEFPKSIEEIAAEIRKSYGYAAARLRYLRGMGKVARLRDPQSNKYRYARMREGAARQMDLSSVQQTLAQQQEEKAEDSREEAAAETEENRTSGEAGEKSPESPQ